MEEVTVKATIKESAIKLFAQQIDLINHLNTCAQIIKYASHYFSIRWLISITMTKNNLRSICFEKKNYNKIS